MEDSGQGKARVLIIEDEGLVAMDIRRRLQRLGYQVVGVGNSSAEAFQMIEAHNPDLALMDIHIRGDLDGIQTAEIARDRYHLPVIYLTAYADETTLRRARVSEAFGYILKPFEERELATNIEMALYKHRMEKRLRESEERFSLAARGANDGIWDWDIHGGKTYYSQRFLEMLGLGENELGERSEAWFVRVHPEDQAVFRLALDLHLQGETEQFYSEQRIRCGENSYRWFLIRGLAVRKENGEAYRMAGSLTDISARKMVEEQLQHDALHDQLTGLPNRSLLLDRLGRVMERARRNPGLVYAVLFLDLDRFKVVNDSLGHQAGDQLLIALARRLGRLLRSADTLARIGGDEFVILLEEISAAEMALRVADRIQEELAQPFEIAGQQLFTSASIGIVIGPSGYEQPGDVLRDADIAMYHAKGGGKARYALFDSSLRQQAVSRMELESELWAALKNDELRVYYQPILSLATGSVTGFEALTRWLHPARGIVLPSEFIPLAEETGLILQIGPWVLEEACRQLRRWQTQFPADPPLYMSVNISSRQFAQPGLVDLVRRTLEETGVEPRTLKLEITEHTIMDVSANTGEALAQLRALGVHVLIDDFGIGYSSLGYVHNFPVDTIKIDRIFINQMGANGGRNEIARTIINLAHELSLGTVAEGIETREQLENLRAMNCDLGQGFLFSKALSRERMDDLLGRLAALSLAGIDDLQNLLDNEA